MSPEAEQYDPKYKVLTKNVERHIKKEEKELLPKSAQTLGDEDETLGERMARRLEQLIQAAGAR